MKLRHPLVVKGLGLAVSWVLRGWINTLCVRYRSLGQGDFAPRRDNPCERVLYCLWHEDIPFLTGYYGGPHLTPLVSEHADGVMISEACRHLRMATVTGSSTRGGVRAVRELLRQRRQTHLAVTPDGPRGPRRQVKPGAVFLAAHSGMPIVPLAAGYRRAWRLRTWDRMTLPLPCSEVVCVTGEPLEMPARLGKLELEEQCRRVQRALVRAKSHAERLATRDDAPGDLATRREDRYRAASFASD